MNNVVLCSVQELVDELRRKGQNLPIAGCQILSCLTARVTAVEVRFELS